MNFYDFFSQHGDFLLVFIEREREVPEVSANVTSLNPITFYGKIQSNSCENRQYVGRTWGKNVGNLTQMSFQARMKAMQAFYYKLTNKKLNNLLIAK